MRLIDDLQRQGITLTVEDDRLHCRGPVDVLTPELRAQLANHKQAIMGHLEQASDELERDIRYAKSLEDLEQLLPLIPEEQAERLVDIGVKVARQLEEGLVNVPGEKFTGVGQA